MNSKKNIDLYSRIDNLENDYVNGSSVIALNGLNIFIDAINIYSNSVDFYLEIKKIAEKIIQTKPMMASLTNIINLALQETISSINHYPQNIYQKIIGRINLAQRTTLDSAIKHLSKYQFNDIITCSYSSAVINLFSELKLRGYDFQVIILESLWKETLFCQNLKLKCDYINIPSRIVNKDSIPGYDFAIIGADSIIKTKGIINGIPSKYLADYSFNLKLPFFVIGESFKNSNKIILDNGFEFIDNHLINHIFSDNIFG